MSKNRFKVLLSHLTFDDYQDRQERWKLDQFAAIRDVWESFNDNLGKCLTPREYESFDETLYPMRHQIAFRQYNSKKPHHYGILFKSSVQKRKAFRDSFDNKTNGCLYQR